MPDHAVDSAAYWDAEAASYAAIRAPSEVDRRVLERVPPVGRVLELGCGNGVFLRQALAHPARDPVHSYIATDVSPAFCGMARVIGQADVRQVDHRHLRLATSSLDTAYAMATLHHLPLADCARLLTRLATWLDRRGTLALLEDWAFTPGSEIEERLRRLRRRLAETESGGEHHPSEQEWIHCLDTAGFGIEEILEVPRVETLDRFASLDSPQSREDLAWLRQQGPDLHIPMTLFVAHPRNRCP